MMKVDDFIKMLKVAEASNTCYLMGGFGCRLSTKNGDWYNKDYGWNQQHADIIQAHMDTTPVTFGFDCVCLIKGVLWGFSGAPKQSYGGAKYESNGVPDMTIQKLAQSCADFSTDWSKDPEVGEIVFYDAKFSHVGVYIGNGEVIESTPAWECGVQRTLLPNRLNPNKLPVRTWYAHGHTSYVDYKKDSGVVTPTIPSNPSTDPMLDAKYVSALSKIQVLETQIKTLNSQIQTLNSTLNTYKSKIQQIKTICG